MKPNVYVSPRELTSPTFAECFAHGMKARNNVKENYVHGKPWAGFGSPYLWDGLEQAIKAGEDFYYGDHAYFGRGKFYRVTKNRFQHDGMGTSNLKRIERFWEKPKKWRKGDHIIVCPQSNNHNERFGEKEWTERILRTLSLYTDRRIIVRMKKDGRPLLADLENAHCVIVHSSNAAVEAILNGVPAICTADCAASRMSLSNPANVEHPYYPEGRMNWAGVLADNQWTFDEIKIGKCWREIQ